MTDQDRLVLSNKIAETATKAFFKIAGILHDISEPVEVNHSKISETVSSAQIEIGKIRKQLMNG